MNGVFETYKARALRWRDAHFECARRYRWIDQYALGIPSVVFATAIFGLSFYLTDQSTAPVWLHYSLLLLAFVQATLAAVQSYLRPGILAETYRNSVANFASVYRRWDILLVKLRIHGTVSSEDDREVMELADKVANDAPPVPSRIFKRFGLPANAPLNTDARQGPRAG